MKFPDIIGTKVSDPKAAENFRRISEFFKRDTLAKAEFTQLTVSLPKPLKSPYSRSTTTTVGSLSIGVSTTADMPVGTLVSGVGILPGTKVASINGATTATLNYAATYSGTSILLFIPETIKIPHYAGFTPKDVIVMANSTGSQVNINFGSQDAEYLSLTYSGATELRLLIGRHEK